MAMQPDATTPGHRSSPLVISVARLGRGPGLMFTVRHQAPSPSRIGLDLTAIEPGSLLDLDLQVASVSEGVLVTGTVAAPTTGECSRCLDTFSGHIEVSLTELFAYPDSVTEATTEDDELGRVIDDTVDLEQAVIDAVGLELPLSPVCRPDCPGLCAQCGIPLASAEPGHHHEQIDPRWAKLAEMLPPEPEESEQ